MQRWDNHDNAPSVNWSGVLFVVAIVFAMMGAGVCEVRAENPDTGPYYAGFHVWSTFGNGPLSYTERASFQPVAPEIDFTLSQEFVLGARMLGRLGESATLVLGAYTTTSGEREVKDPGSLSSSPVGYVNTDWWRFEVGLRIYVGRARGDHVTDAEAMELDRKARGPLEE